jgi:hypothetical protein
MKPIRPLLLLDERNYDCVTGMSHREIIVSMNGFWGKNLVVPFSQVVFSGSVGACSTIFYISTCLVSLP